MNISLVNFVIYSKFPIFYDNVNSLLMFIRSLGVFRIIKKVLMFILVLLGVIIAFMRIVFDIIKYLHTYKYKALYLKKNLFIYLNIKIF